MFGDLSLSGLAIGGGDSIPPLSEDEIENLTNTLIPLTALNGEGDKRAALYYEADDGALRLIPYDFEDNKIFEVHSPEEGLIPMLTSIDYLIDIDAIYPPLAESILDTEVDEEGFLQLLEGTNIPMLELDADDNLIVTDQVASSPTTQKGGPSLSKSTDRGQATRTLKSASTRNQPVNTDICEDVFGCFYCEAYADCYDDCEDMYGPSCYAGVDEAYAICKSAADTIHDACYAGCDTVDGSDEPDPDAPWWDALGWVCKGVCSTAYAEARAICLTTYHSARAGCGLGMTSCASGCRIGANADCDLLQNSL
jgi:hypothetical protein